MKANGFNTGVASEYLILSKLYRLDLEAYISHGNKKSVDIRLIRKDGIPISIDVKSVRGYSSLVVNNVVAKHDHFIVFVIYNNKFDDLTTEPEIYIVPSSQLEHITENYGSEKRVLKGSLESYKNKWEYLTEGYGEDSWEINEQEEEWINFVNCHGVITFQNAPIAETLAKFNFTPERFIFLQRKLNIEQHINENNIYSSVFSNYTTDKLSSSLKTIRSQNIEGETQEFGDRIETELNIRSKEELN